MVGTPPTKDGSYLMADLSTALAAIDAANAADPTLEDGKPAAIVIQTQMTLNPSS